MPGDTQALIYQDTDGTLFLLRDHTTTLVIRYANGVEEEREVVCKGGRPKTADSPDPGKAVIFTQHRSIGKPPELKITLPKEAVERLRAEIAGES